MQTTSEEAIDLQTIKMRERQALEIIKSFGPDGCISDEVRAAAAERYGVYHYSSMTARWANLERTGRILRDGTKRRGLSGRRQLVMVFVK